MESDAGIDAHRRSVGVRVCAMAALTAVLSLGPPLSAGAGEDTTITVDSPAVGAWVGRAFDVTGSVTGDGSLRGRQPIPMRVYVNGQAAQLSRGRYRTTIRPRADGPLQVLAEYTKVYPNGGRLATASRTVTVQVDATKPVVRWTLPAGRTAEVTAGPNLLRGEVLEKNLRDLRVNGIGVEVDPAGRFTTCVLAGAGETRAVEVVASDHAGNVGRTTVTLVGSGAAAATTDAVDPGAVASATLESTRTAAEATLVRELERQAADAEDQRNLRHRDRVFTALLRVAPDHVGARAALGFRRDAESGAWIPPTEGRAATDGAPAALPAANDRLLRALGAYRDAMLAAVTRLPELPDAAYSAVIEELVGLLPDDRAVREARGDVQRDGQWMMAETSSAITVRRRFGEVIAEAERAAAAEIVPVETLPKAFEGEGFQFRLHPVFAWTGQPWARDSLRLAVLGSHLSLEIARTLRASEAEEGDVDAEPDRDARRSARPALPQETLIFPTRALARRWLLSNPKRLSADDFRHFAEFGAIVTHDGTYVVYFGAEPFRRTSVLARTVRMGVWTAVAQLAADRAWFIEGLTRRIAHQITDLPLTEAASAEDTMLPAEDTEEPPLPESPRDWMRAAASLLASGGRERVARVLTVRLNAMGPSDLLVSYALAAYLIEGRPDAAKQFVAAAYESDDAATIVRKGLGWDLGALNARLRRWLAEQDTLPSGR